MESQNSAMLDYDNSKHLKRVHMNIKTSQSRPNLQGLFASVSGIWAFARGVFEVLLPPNLLGLGFRV